MPNLRHIDVITRDAPPFGWDGMVSHKGQIYLDSSTGDLYQSLAAGRGVGWKRLDTASSAGTDQLFIDVVTGNEPRGSAPGRRIWVGGSVQPANWLDGDIWMADEPLGPPVEAQVATSSFNSIVVGVAFSQTFAANGTAPYSWSATGLPAGLTMHPQTGIVSGQATTAGSGNAVITATGPGGGVPRTLAWTVAAAGIAPTILTTPAPPAATVGVPYSWVPGRQGNTPQTWGVSLGSLPAGLAPNSSTGAISGTPTTAGSQTFTLQSTNAFGSDTQEFTITVNEPVEFATVFGDAPYPYPQSLFNDGGNAVMMSTAFYRAGANGPFQVEGGRVYLDELPPANAGDMVVWYVRGVNNGTDKRPLGPSWSGIPSEIPGQFVTIPYANLVVGWNEVLFPTKAVIQGIPANVATAGYDPNTWVWVGYHFTNKIHYFHNGSPFDEPLQSPSLPGLYMAESVFGGVNGTSLTARSMNPFGDTNAMYGIDILASDA